MKAVSRTYRSLAVLILATVFILGSWSYPQMASPQSSQGRTATVEALQGEAEVFWEGQQEERKLKPGDAVEAWNTIITDQKSRLLLRWDNGVVTSLGDFSSIFLSSEQVTGGQLDNVQVAEGIVRVVQGQQRGSTVPYSVVTPTAVFEPAAFDQPTDFIVEVYDPSTTVLTVVAGYVKVRSLKGGTAMGTTVSRCQTVSIEDGKDQLEVLESSPEDIGRLVRETTIPGTITAAADSCIVVAAVERAPVPPRYVEPEPSSVHVYPATPDYYVEDWDSYDFSPYEEIVVLPPRPGVGCIIVVPGIGEFVIPLTVFGSWAYDPAVVQVWASNFFFDRIVYYNWHHLRDCQWRRKQLYNTVYLAQLAGNGPLLRQARHELDRLNVRTSWLESRIRRLEGKVADLNHHQRRLAPQLPRGLNLNNAMADAFSSPKNLPSVNKFQNRLKADQDVQGRLVNIAGNELVQMRSQLAREKNPEKRLAMRNELTRFRNDIAQDKLPIPPKQTEVRNLVTQLSKEKDPNNQERIQKQLLNRLEKTEPGRVPEVLDKGRLDSLKGDLSKFPNPEKRRDLESQLTQLQKSVEVRRESEAAVQKAEELTAQAAREKNPEKQQELIGKLKEMSGPLAIVGGAAAGVGAMQLIKQRQQNLEKQVGAEKDQAKRSTLQQSLDELKKRQTELQQQEVPRQRQPELQRPPETDRQRRLDFQKQEQLERQKQEQEKRTLRLRQQQEERDKQLQLKRQQQEDRVRDMQLRRQQQEDSAKQLEQRRLEQQERRKLPQTQIELDRLKRQQEQQQQPQQQRLQQPDGEKQLQQRAVEQEERRKQAEELKRQEQIKLQQDRSRKDQEQMRLQQEKTRTEQLKQQQDRARQDQLRQQQEQSRQQQLRIQQDQLRQQQEQGRQQQLRQQQEQQLRQQQQQQQQMRQQQLQQQQQQMRQQQQQQQQRQPQEQQRLQQLREEEAKKRKP